MAPKRKNDGANPRQNLFTAGALPDKDFNQKAGSEDSQGRENSLSSNKRSASCDQNGIHSDPKRSIIGSFDSSDDDNVYDEDNDADSIEELISGKNDMNLLGSSNCSSKSPSNPSIPATPLMMSTPSMISTPSSLLKSSSSTTSETKNQIIHISSAVVMKDLEIGHGLLRILRDKGYCRPHFQNMKLPQVTIYVADSPLGGDKRHSISVQFEILVRKLLNIFAKDPSKFAPEGSLRNEVNAYGALILGLDEERLIAPELYEAMMNNTKVSYPTLYFTYIY